MSEAIIPNDGNEPDLSGLTNEELAERFARGLRVTAEGLLDSARCWREFERRGVDMSELRSNVSRYIALIAARRLHAEAVVAFLDQPSKLRAIEGLSLDRQAELAKGGTVEVFDPTTKKVQAVTFASLPFESLGHVFRYGREIPPDEQRLQLKDKKPADKPNVKTIKVNREDGIIQIGKTKTPIASVMGAMADAAGRKGNIDPNQHARDGMETIVGQVTADEKRRIEAFAKASGIPTTELVRRACLGFMA